MATRTLGKLIYSTIQANTLKNIKYVGPVLRLYGTPASQKKGETFIYAYFEP